jgi:hypothetical protein
VDILKKIYAKIDQCMDDGLKFSVTNMKALPQPSLMNGTEGHIRLTGLGKL